MMETLKKGWEWAGTPDGNSKMLALALLAATLAPLFAVFGLPFLGLAMAHGTISGMFTLIIPILALNIINHNMNVAAEAQAA